MAKTNQVCNGLCHYESTTPSPSNLQHMGYTLVCKGCYYTFDKRSQENLQKEAKAYVWWHRCYRRRRHATLNNVKVKYVPKIASFGFFYPLITK